MGTPQEYMRAENSKAIDIIKEEIETRESHMDDLDIAQVIITAFDGEGLIVVNKEEWQLAMQLLSVVKAVAAS